ncbi:MAG: hypothetical protein AAF632_15770 [Bacteroidota bacterium]
MLRNISIILSVLLVLAGGVYSYREYIAEPDLRPIGQLVAEEALWVYHSQHFPEDWANMQDSPIGRLIAAVPDIQAFTPGLSTLDSTALLSLLRNHSLYIACQVVGNDDIGFSFYINLEGTNEPADWKKLVEGVKASPEWKIESQQYQGVSIQEWVYQPKPLRFSWIRVDNFLVGSFTPFLVEDQIRRLGKPDASRPSWRRMIKQRAFSQRDQGDITVNGQQLSRFFSVFLTDQGSQPGFLTHSLADCLMLDLSVENDQWLLSGFSEASLGSQYYPTHYLSTFDNQSAASFGIGNYLPNRTAAVRQWSFSDVSSWVSQYTNFVSQNRDSTRALAVQQRFQKETGGSVVDWFSWAGSEWGVITLETRSGQDYDQLIVVEITDAVALEEAMASVADGSDEPVYQETYAGYTLQNLYDSALPGLLLGNFSTESTEYFWYHDTDYLILSNSLNALKRLISDQATENTWGKSPYQLRFLERSVNPANVTLLLDMTHYQDHWIDQLSPKWSEWAKDHERVINQLNKVALQFSVMGEEYYTSMIMTYQAEDQNSTIDFITTQRQRLDTLIASKPFVVRGGDQKIRVMVQDQRQVVHLLNPAQPTIQWSDSSLAAVVGEVVQIDLLRAASPNYIWATDSAMHIVDRSGNRVDGYPFYLPQNIQVQFLSVFDYEQDGNYRFLVTDPLGQLWLFTADRDNLAGWNPLSLTAPLATAPQHFRVRGKDCIVALLENGLLHLLNRRGEPYPGFPVDLGQACENPLFIKTGNSFADSELTTITQGGELLSLNLEGKLLRREQLVRPSSNAHFTLCTDRLEKDFILVRQDDQRLSILDENGTLWFEQSYFTPGGLARNELSVQYYNFETDRQVIAITDKVQEFTYLFNRQGQLVNNRPVESSGDIALLYSEAGNTYQLYRVYEDELAVITF